MRMDSARTRRAGDTSPALTTLLVPEASSGSARPWRCTRKGRHGSTKGATWIGEEQNDSDLGQVVDSTTATSARRSFILQNGNGADILLHAVLLLAQSPRQNGLWR